MSLVVVESTSVFAFTSHCSEICFNAEPGCSYSEISVPASKDVITPTTATCFKTFTETDFVVDAILSKLTMLIVYVVVSSVGGTTFKRPLFQRFGSLIG